MMSFKRATPRGFTAAAALVTVLAVGAPARAGSPEDRAAARQHLSQAKDAKKAGQLAEACEHLEQVEKLDPKLPTLIELAECTEELGKLVEAERHWAAARDRAKQTEKPQSRAKAEERLAAVEKRVARLTLVSAPDGAQVFRGDVAVDPSTLGSPLSMNPGEHVIVVKLAGHDDAQYAVTLAEGDNQTLAIPAGPATKAAAPPPPPPPPPPKPVAPPPPPPESSSNGSGQRTAGLVLGGAGLVSAGVGAPLWFIGYRDGNSLGPTADQQLLAGQILVIGGGVLFVTGAVLFFTAPSGDAPAKARLPVSPTLLIGRESTYVGAVGEF